MVDVRQRAQWFDVKWLVRKHLGIKENQLHVKRFVSGHWNGWLVDIYIDADLATLKREINNVSVVGERNVFIGIVE